MEPMSTTRGIRRSEARALRRMMGLYQPIFARLADNMAGSRASVIAFPSLLYQEMRDTEVALEGILNAERLAAAKYGRIRIERWVRPGQGVIRRAAERLLPFDDPQDRLNARPAAAMFLRRVERDLTLRGDVVRDEDSPEKVRRKISTVLDSELRRLARLNATLGESYGAFATLDSFGVAGKRWVTVEDEDVRHSHELLHGEAVPLWDAFDNGLMYPGDTMHGTPKDWMNCFPPGQTFVSPAIEKSYERVYQGELISIKTSSGNQLSGTPNHPILTDRGWFPLKRIVEGTHIVRSRGFRGLSACAPDQYGEPSELQEFHRSLTEAGVLERVGLLPFDFHGDGGDGEVNVVDMAGKLRGGGESYVPQHLHELELAFADVAERTLVMFGSGDACLDVIAGTSPGLLSGSGVSSVLLQGSGLDREPVRFGVGPSLDPGPFEPSSDGVPVYTQALSDGVLGLPSDVSLDDVVRVEVSSYHGPVYNLQTVSGWYIVEGIVTGNCRCWIVPATRTELQAA